MQPGNFVRIYVLTVILVVSFLTTWEYYWRSRGFGISFNDDKVMWSSKRKKVYAPKDDATVFIGSSRIKFDLDIPTWEKLTGEQAIQLAFVGTSPRPVLHHLARDRKFNGKVVIEVMEPSFFAMDSVRREVFALRGINYFDEETPAQKAGVPINFLLESNLVFLEEGKFGLNALMNNVKLPQRDGIAVHPTLPKEFSFSTADRQSVLTSMFMSDEKIQTTVIDTWKKIGSSNKTIPVTGKALEAYFNELKSSIDKIRSRGGSVVFVRPPSSSFYRERENRLYPRVQYWDRLLKHTKTEGHHYEDYTETAGLVCPDGSHLSPNDAIAYTEHLVKLLRARPW
jgi:hypothetical protein